LAHPASIAARNATIACRTIVCRIRNSSRWCEDSVGGAYHFPINRRLGKGLQHPAVLVNGAVVAPKPSGDSAFKRICERVVSAEIHVFSSRFRSGNGLISNAGDRRHLSFSDVQKPVIVQLVVDVVDQHGEGDPTRHKGARAPTSVDLDLCSLTGYRQSWQ
jgi:hypothetical protein